MTEPWEEACNLLDNYLNVSDDIPKEYVDESIAVVIKELREAKSENTQLNAELGKCAWHGAFEEYEEDIQKLREENEWHHKQMNEAIKSGYIVREPSQEIERLKAEVVRLSTVDWQSAYADEMHKNQDLQAEIAVLKERITLAKETLEIQ